MNSDTAPTVRRPLGGVELAVSVGTRNAACLKALPQILDLGP